MVAHEWVERPELHPSRAHLLVGHSIEATDIGSHQRKAVHLKLEHGCRMEQQKRNRGSENRTAWWWLFKSRYAISIGQREGIGICIREEERVRNDVMVYYKYLKGTSKVCRIAFKIKIYRQH